MTDEPTAREEKLALVRQVLDADHPRDAAAPAATLIADALADLGSIARSLATIAAEASRMRRAGDKGR